MGWQLTNISTLTTGTDSCRAFALAQVSVSMPMFAGKSYVASVAHRAIRNEKANEGPPR